MQASNIKVFFRVRPEPRRLKEATKISHGLMREKHKNTLELPVSMGSWKRFAQMVT